MQLLWRKRSQIATKANSVDTCGLGAALGIISGAADLVLDRGAGVLQGVLHVTLSNGNKVINKRSPQPTHAQERAYRREVQVPDGACR